MITDTSREIIYILVFSIGTGMLFSRTVFSLIRLWQEEEIVTSENKRRYRG